MNDLVEQLRDYQKWMKNNNGQPSIDINDIDGNETFGAAADRIAELETLLRECADDIAQACHDDHPYRDEYPDQMRRYKRDMDIVYRVRAALTEKEDG